MTVTIYHNPGCGTSRNVLALLESKGISPKVVEYLKNPPSKAEIKAIARHTGGVRPLLRERGTPYEELGLADSKWSDDQLIDFIVKHPILLNRPVVVTDEGAALCRPSEKVLDLLED